jgi:hypothetical protein
MRIALLGLVVPLAGCPLLDVQVEVGEIRLTHRDVVVDGAGPLSTSFVFDDLSGIHEITDRDTELELVRAELRPTSGPVDFAFVEAATVTLASDTLPELVAYDCAGDCVTGDGTLEIRAAVQRDVVDYLRGDSVTVAIDLAGETTASWTMDVDIYVRGRVHESYAP